MDGQLNILSGRATRASVLRTAADAPWPPMRDLARRAASACCGVAGRGTLQASPNFFHDVLILGRQIELLSCRWRTLQCTTTGLTRGDRRTLCHPSRRVCGSPEFGVSAMTSSALSGRSILIVEAEPVSALEVETGLRNAGAKVFGVHQLRDALYMAEHPALSAAVMAQRMGEDKTDAVCRRLADLGIPFMFHTRYDASEARQKWPNAPVVTKPGSAQELISAVVGLL
jgi:CheY-like chemotaxis protein